MGFRFFLSVGAILAGLAVAFGAFASHALKTRLDDRALSIFETGARYQMYHAIALILVSILMAQAQVGQSWLTTSGTAFLVGIALFSGSLYALSLTGVKWLGAIAPLGGAAFLIGWACLAIVAWSYKS
jgi:uncharacterized membrane protein YgdD (TMEM256/DUF423 family)